MENGHTIKIESTNIRLGRVRGLEAAIRSLQQGNAGICVLQETKLTKGIHVSYSAG